MKRAYGGLKAGDQTGLRDQNGNMIYVGDTVELVLGENLRRKFLVEYKTVIREVVSHPTFNEPTAKVAITGIVFHWIGTDFDLFPCVDDDGNVDTDRMKICKTYLERE